jgi:hypothetical protein
VGGRPILVAVPGKANGELLAAGLKRSGRALAGCGPCAGRYHLERSPAHRGGQYLPCRSCRAKVLSISAILADGGRRDGVTDSVRAVWGAREAWPLGSTLPGSAPPLFMATLWSKTCACGRRRAARSCSFTTGVAGWGEPFSDLAQFTGHVASGWPLSFRPGLADDPESPVQTWAECGRFFRLVDIMYGPRRPAGRTAKFLARPSVSSQSTLSAWRVRWAQRDGRTVIGGPESVVSKPGLKRPPAVWRSKLPASIKSPAMTTEQIVNEHAPAAFAG